MSTKISVMVIRLALLIGTIISLTFVPWIVLKAWIAPLPDTMQEQVDDAIGFDFDGMIVYTDVAGLQPQYFASGWHDREKQIPADPKALFKIASISKLYVAVSIAKMAHANQVSLDKTLAEYFPEYADRIEYSDRITVRMMVRHRSGIPNYTNSPGFWVNQPNERDSALLFALDLPASFKPDKKYEYSNTNYLLLRQLIEKITGENSHNYIKQNILEPLGLKNTYGSLDEVNMDDMMSGYYVGYEGDLKYKDQGMVASAEDVGKFIRALNDGSVFSGEEQEIYSSIYVYDHTGLVPGYQSIARYHKGIDAVVVQFMSTTDFEGYNWSLSEVFYKRIVKILKKSR